VSQEKAKMLASLDPTKLTPFEIEQLGGREKIERETKLAQQLIESEKVSPNAKLSIKNQPVKEAAKPIAKPVEEKNEPKKLWRVMLEGGDSSKDTFFDTRDKAEAELKRMGGKGAVAGIKFPAKTAGEEEKLRDEYIFRAGTKGRVASTVKPETEEERLTRKLTEAGATPEQRDRYLKNLERLSSGREERELASKERASKFRSDIAAKRASEEQLNQYNKQLSTLKRAYREARMSGDYVEQYRIGDFINSYTAGVPKEMGARQKASQRGIIENRNKELAEMVRRDKEARIAAERASRANPDYQQYNSVY
jgi:hypothetical protein